MSAQFTTCAKEDQHAVIQFLWAEGVRGTKIHHRLLAQYSDSICCRKACISELTHSKVAKQVSLMNH